MKYEVVTTVTLFCCLYVTKLLKFGLRHVTHAHSAHIPATLSLSVDRTKILDVWNWAVKPSVLPFSCGSVLCRV